MQAEAADAGHAAALRRTRAYHPLLPFSPRRSNWRAVFSRTPIPLRLSSARVQVEKENQSMADMRWRRLPQDALGHFLANYEQVRRPTQFRFIHMRVRISRDPLFDHVSPRESRTAVAVTASKAPCPSHSVRQWPLLTIACTALLSIVADGHDAAPGHAGRQDLRTTRLRGTRVLVHIHSTCTAQQVLPAFLRCPPPFFSSLLCLSLLVLYRTWL